MILDGMVVDLDGTVYHGDAPLPGADAAIDAIRDRGIDICFFSNNPIHDGREYVERLRGMGIDAREGEACSSGVVTREYLDEEHAGDDVFLIGSDRLRGLVERTGARLAADPADTDVLLASWTDGFHYRDMVDALRAVDDDTAFLGTDPDRTIPTAEGLVPGSGAVIGAVARTVGREPDRVLGKPSPEAAEDALARLGVPAENCLVVGDRLDTDLAMGADHGMRTALVLTGVSTRADATESPVDPDAVLDSLADLPPLID